MSKRADRRGRTWAGLRAFNPVAFWAGVLGLVLVWVGAVVPFVTVGPRTWLGVEGNRIVEQPGAWWLVLGTLGVLAGVLLAARRSKGWLALGIVGGLLLVLLGLYYLVDEGSRSFTYAVTTEVVLAPAAGPFIVTAGAIITTLSLLTLAVIASRGRPTVTLVPAAAVGTPAGQLDLARLEKLIELRDAGGLTESEFQEQKQRLLDAR